MSENNIIKSITTQFCPHCKEEFYIESQMEPPVVSSLFTPKDVVDAKADCLARVATLSVDDEKKETVEKWVNDPNTLFSRAEVDSIISSLLKPAE